MDTEAQRLREALCGVGRSLHARGYAHATAGNLSARLADGGMLITPTDACLGTLEPDRLARLDAQGQQRGGDRASKTAALHRAIYAAAPAARCIVHTHSTHLVALTLQGVWAADAVLPPITPYQVMKVGPVPLIPYHLPGDDAVPGLVAERLAARPSLRGVLLERLGPVVWHESPEAAAVVLEELEETARLWLLCRPRPSPLAASAVQALCARFGVDWPAPPVDRAQAGSGR